MRIVGGKFKGRALATPKSDRIRPTTDRVRESLFNILQHRGDVDFGEARVLDLFAGTGALAIEALSRGAEFAMFFETSAEGRGLLRQNIDTLELTGCTKVSRQDSTKPGLLGKLAPFNLVFADPPYGNGLGEKALIEARAGGWIDDGAIVVLEEASEILLSLPPEFRLIDERKFGATKIEMFRVGGA